MSLRNKSLYIEEQNEMLHDMANAFLNIANGMCDTEAVKYSTLNNIIRRNANIC